MRGAFLATLAITLIACGGDAALAGGDTPWTTEVDSTGDTIRIRIAGAIPERLVRTLVPELRIGAQDGTEEETFGSLDEIIAAADGNVLIYDGQARTVRLFDSTGAFVRQIGSKGGGPGEHGYINGITRRANGEWVFWDADGGRLNRYTAAGDFVTTVRLPITGWYLSDGLGADQDGRIYVWTTLGRDAATGQATSVGYLRLDTLGAVLDTLAWPSWGPDPPMLRGESPDGRSSTVMGLPFSGGSQTVLAPSGELIAGPGAEYVFYRLPRAGRPVRVEREHSPVPVSSTEASERKAQITQNMLRLNPSWSWTGPDIPAIKPAYRELLAGEDGRTWVRLWTAAEPIPPDELPPVVMTSGKPRVQITTREPNLYDVFSADGRLLGRVSPPPRTRLLRMDGDVVWGVTLDSLDVSYAVRYRITPGLPR